MFKNKSEVDRHVHNCLKKVNNETERNLRCFSFAKLYFSVGDYDQAYRYISSYLLIKPKAAEGHLLLAKCLEKLGKLDSALEAYKKCLQIDPKQNNVVIKVCELMSSDNIELDLSGARYFCELAQSFDPNNPAVHSLKDRLLTVNNENPVEITQLLLKELEIRPTDINLRIRLLKHLIQNNMIKEAYKHVSMIEYKDFDNFHHSINWYENLVEILILCQKDISFQCEITWEFWLLLVSVMERLVALRLDDRNNYKGTTDYRTVLFNFDQMLYKATGSLDTCTDRQLISIFIMHYYIQLHFHISTLILKEAKKDVIQYKEASNIILPALFTSYYSPPDIQSIWYTQSDEKTKKLIQRWYKSACFRCSQVGHILLAMGKDNRSVLLEKASQYSSGLWREQLYKKIFVKRDQHNKMSTSFFVANKPCLEPTLKLPIVTDLLKYDEVAQLSHPDSLHHYVWIFLNSDIEMNLIAFEGMQYSIKNLSNCSAESLNLLDVYAFIYCATFCAKSKLNNYNLLPASIMENLATTEQSAFIQCVYKMYKNMASSNLADVRLTLIKGIETVRCVGHHGLDVRTLVNLATLFKDRATKLTKQSEIDFNITRAELYWKTALPLLEKIANNQKISYINNRLFESGSNELTTTEAIKYMDKGKLFIATQLMNRKFFDEALNMFEELKDPYASYHQFEIYKQFAISKMDKKGDLVQEEINNEIYVVLTKARDCLYLTLDRLRQPSVDPSHPLNTQLDSEINKIEKLLSRNELGYSRSFFSEETRSFNVSVSDECVSNSTKVEPLNQSTPLRLNLTRQEARPSPERLDAQIRQLMTTRDAIFTLVSEQNKHMAEAQNNLLEKLNSVVNDLKLIKKEVEGLKEVSKSVNEIKNSVEDFQNVIDVVQEMKKDLAEMKKPDTKNQLSDEDLYVLDPDYGVDYNIPSNMGSFPPMVPGSFPNYQTNKIPNPHHVAAYPPAMLFPGLYPGLPYTYGGLNLAQPGPLPFLTDHQPTNVATTTPSHHLLPNQPSLSQHLGFDSLNIQSLPSAIPQTNQQKELPKSTIFGTNLKLPSTTSPIVPSFSKTPPVNVVITTSDPLPTGNTLTSQPVLSVTIPPQHIKSNLFKAPSTSAPEKADTSIKINEKSDRDKRLDDTNESLNKSDVSPEEEEPNITFKPVIPLPDEVPVNTGEEGETELFCGRAKLFRCVTVDGTKEWKERGVGNLKILKNPQTRKTRILMRRDQVLKICANHFITKEMTLLPSTQNDRAFTWAAQDFSDGEIKSETLCVKFKSIEDARKFADVFKQSAESKLVKTTSESGTSLGGFVFTGTPTFSHVEPKPAADLTEVKETNKTSPFSTFVFGKPPQDTKPIGTGTDDGPSSPLEEFVPTAEFKPVVDLPELIDVKTGEENSEILFEERAKLFRFDTSGEVNEWKERGIGTLKVLKDESIRLLMRRDQVHKVCCNHRVLKDMIFKINSNNPKAVVWQAQDFSEGVIKQEMFTARFKTEKIASEFLEILRKAKENMDENSAVDSARNKKDTDKTFDFVSIGEIQNEKPEIGGFGDAFKMKPGDWECQSCMVRNYASAVKCVVCGDSKKEGLQQTVIPSIQNKMPVVSGFGDAFKIQPGSWECKTCMIRNDSTVTKCVACGTDKESGLQKDTQVQSSIEKQVQKVSGFGDAFKMKPGHWECQSCMIRNEADVTKCVACGTSKDGGLQEKETVKSIETPVQKFTFGVPTDTKLTFDVKDNSTNVIAPVQNAQWKFGFVKSEVTPTKPIEETKTPLESVKSVPDKNSFSFISPTKQEFTFKPPPKKTNDDSDSSYVEEEEDNIYFKPVIPLPDKIQVKTGEEDDDVLYCHKAKLFRFVDKEWKERGIGDIKILKNKSNQTLRVVMRREQVLKICLNHLLTKKIDYKFRDEKSLMFMAADYSEGTLVNQLFCVRFKNGEIANDFKKAIDTALETEKSIQCEGEKDGVEIVFETEVTPEEEQEAVKLGLPPKFMSYKQLPDCECEQCEKDDEYLKDLFPKVQKNKEKTLVSTPSNTPVKSSDNSEGTPGKNVSTTSTVFTWPTSTTSNSFSFANFSFTSSFLPQTTKSGNVTPNNKEVFDTSKAADGNKSTFSFDNNQFKSSGNIFAQAPSGASIFGQNVANSNTSNIFGNKSTNMGSIFDFKPKSTADSGKTGFLFGQWNISVTEKPKETENVASKTGGDSSFASPAADTKEKSAVVENVSGKTGFLFGPSSKPVEQKQPDDSILKSDTKLSFASSPAGLKETDDPVFKSDPNISFASLAAGSNNKDKPGSIGNGKNSTFNVSSGKLDFSFGQGIKSTVDLKETDDPVFKSDPNLSFASLAAGSNNKDKPGSIGNGENSTFNVSSGKLDFSFGQGIKSTVDLKETDDPVLNSDSNLSFTSLAANSKANIAPAFTQNTDKTFSFLGAGTPLFSSQKTNTPNKTKSDSCDEQNVSSVSADEYDPHYEPIVPLPQEITVITGEEDEQILFIERARLYRYDSDLKVWKERGIGNIKVLHNPEKNTYRLLLRREIVHKLVLNQLITPNLELKPMASSEKAWVWSGQNYCDDELAFEKLAVRFKIQQRADEFYKIVQEVVKKIGMVIPEAVEDFNIDATPTVIDPLYTETNDDYEYDDEDDDDDDDDEEDERTVMFEKTCSLSELNSDDCWEHVGEGCLEVYYDPDLYAARIVIADDSGCVLSNTVIGTNTEMELIKNECIWRSVDWEEGNVRWRKLKVKFSNESAAEEFHSSYIEGLNYAQQIGYIDELPIEPEEE
ncbi:E3 SUMO-protein ligase RanBP2-like [Diorhabda sublineata]|uniref:E3 SUMO-protein ligase RanBP2-like n=1 Tax=Diorhabda sublineata TaxID=1163346 RepID=UPI0024E048B7|nr:E3 SUMO-protein ligase RanBP2-like [Diorhabda sublineata]